MASDSPLDFPDGFEAWPRSVQERWLSDYHALYFPKLRWWDLPESFEEDSGPRPSQLPPDHPRHPEPDLSGNRCGCDGNPDWSTWLLLTGRGWGKALDLGTMIPVPSGWKELGEIAVGDEVFDEAGRVCRVTATYDIMPSETYRLTFSDGTTLDACADHQWVTWTHAERKAFLRSPYEDTSRFPENWPAWRLRRLKGRQLGAQVVNQALELQAAGLSVRKICRRLSVSRNSLTPHLAAGRYISREAIVYPDSPGPQIRTTAEIVKTLTVGARGDTNHCIPTCGALGLPDASLPVDPYVLGVWLGDGSSAAARVTVCDDEADELLGLLAIAGAPLSGVPARKEGAACASYPIGIAPLARDPATGRMVSRGGLHADLAALGLINNKHVPAVYLRASVAQRLALLQGLMDTDGGWDRERVEFGSSNPRLAEAVVELARSLGQKPVSAESRAMLKGKDCGPRWRVQWTPTVNVFRLSRKAERFKTGGAQSLRNHHRMIVSAELIDPVPMRCLTVDSPHHMYLAGEGMIPTHNTLCGANWVIEMALSRPGIYIGVCAPTDKAVRSICLEGESGVMAVARRYGIEIVDYNKNRLEITFANDSKIRGFSAEKPDSIRGENLAYAWFDELAMIRYFSFFHEGLQPALRKGGNPRLLITTTPKRVRLLRDLLADGENEAQTGVHVTRGVTAENPHFAKRQRETLERKYAGTYMLKQELEGELLAEVDGALFPLEQFNETRVFPDRDSLPQWRRVVVGYDPATTSSAHSDESGIVVMAEGADGDYYCLEDCSGRYTPEQAMKVIDEAYYRCEADCVVAETNVAGDFIRSLMNTINPNIPIRAVSGMKGKVARAQGPSSLFMQGRVHHVGDVFGKLEDQLSAMTTEDDRSRMHDDRADAWVWCMLHLSGAGQGDWGMVYGFQDCPACGARVNYEKDKACANCGIKVVPVTPKHAGGRPVREPWSIAYLKTCVNPECGKKYAPRERSCPHCSRDPESFLREAVQLSTGQGGRYSYTGRDWLTGRRI